MSDGANVGVLAVNTRHEHDKAVGLTGGEHSSVGACGLEGNRDGHVRQDDAVVKRQQR